MGAQCAHAQTTQPSSTAGDPPAAKKKYAPTTDIAVGLFGQTTAARFAAASTTYAGSGTSWNQVTQSTAPSGGFFGTFHQQFKPWLGYNANAGFTRLTEHYSNAFQFTPVSGSGQSPSSSFARGAVRTSRTDLSIAAALEGPHTSRFSTFAQFGGGGLFFSPMHNSIGARSQIRPAMLFGAGANMRLTGHLDLRAEYRGYFYKSPDFNVADIQPGVTPTSQFPMTRLFTVASEPAVSLVYRFGGAAKTEKTKPQR